MSPEISRQEPIRKAIHTKEKLFDSIPIMTAKTVDDSWVLYAPIVDIIGERSAMGSLYNKRVPILVSVGGKDELMHFVSLADFVGTAIITSRHKSFGDFVVAMIEEFEDRGFAPPINHKDHPLVAMWTAGLTTAYRVAELEQKTDAMVRRQDSLETGQKQLEDQVKENNSIISHGQKFVIAMVGLGQRGIKIPEGMRSDVGKELAAIGRSLGYPVDTYPNGKQSKFPPEPVGIFFPLFYPTAVLNRIIDAWVLRNKNNPDRQFLFTKSRV